MADDFKFPSRIIPDASFILCCLFPDEQLNLEGRELFLSFSRGEIEFFAPLLLEMEILNGLRSAILAKRISEKEAQILEEKFYDLEISKITFEREKILDLSLKHKTSVYDAVYLSCSQVRKMPIYTCDRKFYQKVKDDFRVFLIN